MKRCSWLPGPLASRSSETHRDGEVHRKRVATHCGHDQAQSTRWGGGSWSIYSFLEMTPGNKVRLGWLGAGGVGCRTRRILGFCRNFSLPLRPMGTRCSPLGAPADDRTPALAPLPWGDRLRERGGHGASNNMTKILCLCVCACTRACVCVLAHVRVGGSAFQLSRTHAAGLPVFALVFMRVCQDTRTGCPHCGRCMCLRVCRRVRDIAACACLWAGCTQSPKSCASLCGHTLVISGRQVRAMRPWVCGRRHVPCVLVRLQVRVLEAPRLLSNPVGPCPGRGAQPQLSQAETPDKHAVGILPGGKARASPGDTAAPGRAGRPPAR